MCLVPKLSSSAGVVNIGVIWMSFQVQVLTDRAGQHSLEISWIAERVGPVEEPNDCRDGMTLNGNCPCLGLSEVGGKRHREERRLQGQNTLMGAERDAIDHNGQVCVVSAV